MKSSFEIIVIGSGPGGCVPAVILAEKGHDVLMIEEGHNYKLSDTVPFSTDEMRLKYRNGGITVAMGRTKTNYVEGRCVGGGSEVNSGLYHRIPEEVLVKWEKANEISFDRSQLENSFEQIEKDINVSYLTVSKPPKASIKLKEGCDKLGWNCKEIPRWHKDDEHGGIKQSMTETFIPRFLASGGSLLPDTRALRISKSNGKNLVHTIDNEGKNRVFTSSYVIISTGSINTPFLLKKSGFKKAVGKNLKLHPSFKFAALFQEKINFKGMGVPVHQVKEFSPEISLGCSISSKPYIGLALSDTGNMNYLSDWERIANYYAMISPEGSGTISAMPFFDSPFVRFKLRESDFQLLYNGVEKLARVLFEAGAVKLFPSVSSPITIEKMEDVSLIRGIPRSKLNLMTIHLFSSVPMGGDKKRFPLNPEGHLWDDPTIYVSDGSMLCDSPSVNPQGTIMALARVNALRLLNKISK